MELATTGGRATKGHEVGRSGFPPRIPPPVLTQRFLIAVRSDRVAIEVGDAVTHPGHQPTAGRLAGR
jgi:hypothetical protein